jgi:hypothetical protein
MSKGEESAGTVRATFHNDLTHDESIQHRAKLPWDRLSNFWNFRQGARPGLKMWLITFAVKKDAVLQPHRYPVITGILESISNIGCATISSQLVSSWYKKK